MNMKKILIALTLALMTSGASTWFVSKKMNARMAPVKIEDLIYVAPAIDLNAGQVLKTDNTELVAWPSTSPVAGGSSRLADLVGREVLFPLAKGQPILDRDLSAPGSGTGFASKIPDGMRAVALRSDEIVGVAGLLTPGSHLDVLVTYRPDGSVEPMTTTVLQNVVVLAAGHQIQPDPAGKISDVTIVTLLLNLEESQRAVLASTQGAIHFVLRNSGDNGHSDESPSRLSQLAGHSALPKHAPAVFSPAAPKRHEIEVVMGGDDGNPLLIKTPDGSVRP